VSKPVSTVRNTLNAVRHDWLGVRIGGSGASMRGLWPLLIAAIVLVFGCSFALGRVLADGRAPTEGSSAAPVERAAIPGGLRGGSPVAGKVPSAIAAPPPRRKPVPAGSTAVRSATAPSLTPSGEAQAPTSGSRAESPPVFEPVPAKASAPSSGSGGAGSSAGGSSESSANGGSGGHAAPSGGSFDSSE